MSTNLTLDLQPDHLKIVKSILQEHAPHLKIYAFGSRVKGGARQYSDLDLLIVNETAVKAETLIALKQAFEESKLPFKVDIIEWINIEPSFRKMIEQDWIQLQ